MNVHLWGCILKEAVSTSSVDPVVVSHLPVDVWGGGLIVIWSEARVWCVPWRRDTQSLHWIAKAHRTGRILFDVPRTLAS